MPFTWSDIQSFCALSGFRPKAWQLKAMRRMEIVWLNHKNKTPESEPDKAKPAARRFSFGLFDAWFGK